MTHSMREDNLISVHMRVLEASERRFCALLERTTDPIVVVDADRKISYISGALCTLLKCDEESAIGQSALDFIKPRSVESLLATIQASDPSEQGPFDLHVTARDGSDLCLEGYRTNLLDDPYVKGILWNLRDVTDTRLAETHARLERGATDGARGGLRRRDLHLRRRRDREVRQPGLQGGLRIRPGRVGRPGAREHARVHPPGRRRGPAGGVRRDARRSATAPRATGHATPTRRGGGSTVGSAI